MRIGIFDSGIGGLTVLKRLIDVYPNHEYIYYGDTYNVPYGNKSKEELNLLSQKIISFLIDKKVDLIIIACGTISSNLAKELQSRYDIEILDIISPTVDFINNSNYEKVGVICTKATKESLAFEKNIKKDIVVVPCSKFVPLIENSNLLELEKVFPEYLDQLKDREIIVLGCTHYPLIKDKLIEYLGKEIVLLDMSYCLPSLPKDNSDIKIELYFSKLDNIIEDNIKRILKEKIYSLNLA